MAKANGYNIYMQRVYTKKLSAINTSQSLATEKVLKWWHSTAESYYDGSTWMLCHYYFCKRVSNKGTKNNNTLYMKREILTKIIEITSNVTEVNMCEIQSKSKRGDAVDARCIFVYHAFKFGIPSVNIANFLGRKRSNVITQYIQNYAIYSRQSLSFRLMSAQVYDKLSVIYPDIGYNL